MKKYLPLLAVLAAFSMLVFGSAQAAAGARQALSLCAATLIPSLFPFFVLANLLADMGLPELLGRSLGGAARRIFHVSGRGVQAFFLGISGGYPLGAATVAGLRQKKLISRQEAERLLPFCNNSGPAFILGAAGGVFGSVRAGLMLYATHVAAALAVGFLLRGPAPPPTDTPPAAPPSSFSRAFPAAVTRAVQSTLAVCGYVVLFSALLGLLAPLQRLAPLWLAMATGFLELGSGIAALRGLPPTASNLAAAAFLLGWGGLSVHFQTLGVLAGTDIKSARHLAGRALCGILAALFTFFLALIFPQ